MTKILPPNKHATKTKGKQNVGRWTDGTCKKVGTEGETLGRWRACSQDGNIVWGKYGDGRGMVVGDEGLMSMGIHGYDGYTQTYIGHMIAWVYGVGFNRNISSYAWMQ